MACPREANFTCSPLKVNNVLNINCSDSGRNDTASLTEDNSWQLAYESFIWFTDCMSLLISFAAVLIILSLSAFSPQVRNGNRIVEN